MLLWNDESYGKGCISICSFFNIYCTQNDENYFSFSLRILPIISSSSSSSSQLYSTTIIDGNTNNNVTNTEKSMVKESHHDDSHQVPSQPQFPSELKKWLDMSVPEGRCIGIVLNSPNKNMNDNVDDCFPQNDTNEDSSSSSSSLDSTIFNSR